MRRGVIASAALLGMLALGACGSESAGSDPTTTDATSVTPSASPTASEACSPAGEELPETSGEYGDAPELTWPDACAPEGLQVEVLSEGDGPEVGAGAAVLANYAGYVWGSDTAFDSSYDRGKASLFSLNSVVDGWATGIPEHAVGSRLLISIPPDLGYGEAGNANAGIAGTDTIVFVIDVVGTFNADAAGEADAKDVAPDDLPVTIEGDLGEAATLSVDADAAEPTEPAIYPISEGSGDPVAAGQYVAIAYTVTYWDGSSTETSWSPAYGETEETLNPSAGPMVTPLGQGTIFDLLDGVTVGSRVVLVAPGSDGSPAIAVVADVLGTD